jgi:GNAT superfamily N-acetyltransferase
MRWTRDNLILTDEPTSTCVEDTYRLLQATYWAHTRPIEVVERILDRSLCFFLLDDDRQVGFGRVISDFVTTSWIADVVLEATCQNQGVGSWMMRCVLEHPSIKDTQFALQTGSAHDFYERLGFARRETLMSTAVDYLS